MLVNHRSDKGRETWPPPTQCRKQIRRGQWAWIDTAHQRSVQRHQCPGSCSGACNEMVMNVDKGVKKLGLRGNMKWCSCSRRQFARLANSSAHTYVYAYIHAKELKHGSCRYSHVCVHGSSINSTTNPNIN